MTTEGRFEDGDTVLLRRLGNHDADPQIIWPLRAAKRRYLKEGILDHDNIIGKRTRDVVTTHTGNKFRIHDPTLEEYVRLTPRLCTPIYAADASLIVSLLDIHIPRTLGHEGPGYAILEAGTGHGSLTLHLARALQAATPSPVHRAKSSGEGTVGDDDSEARQDRETTTLAAAIHSVDNSETRSKHAQQIVRDFRAGLYSDNVQFHVSEVDSFLEQVIDSSPGDAVPRMFDHIILDLPDAHAQMHLAARVLKVDGCLLLWVPSVTQILKAMQIVRDEGLPLSLERVVEAGEGISSGRIWDVRWARVRDYDRKARGLQKANEAQQGPDSTAGEDGASDTSGDGSTAEAQTRTSNASGTKVRDPGEVVVCRPKVGDRIRGGGFIGLWRCHREREG